MQKFIEKGIRHVERIFPSIYETRPVRGSYHFSLAYLRNNLIAIGLNKPEKENAKAFRFAKQFGLTEKLKFPFIHSEEDLVGKLIGMDKLSSSLNIVILRMNKFGVLGESKPCKNCATILKAVGLTRLFWSDSNGEICCEKV